MAMNDAASCIQSNLSNDRTVVINFRKELLQAELVPKPIHISFCPNQDAQHSAMIAQSANVGNGWKACIHRRPLRRLRLASGMKRRLRLASGMKSSVIEAHSAAWGRAQMVVCEH